MSAVMDICSAISMISSGLMVIQTIWFLYRYLKGLELGHTPIEKFAKERDTDLWLVTLVLFTPFVNVVAILTAVVFWIIFKASDVTSRIRERNIEKNLMKK